MFNDMKESFDTEVFKYAKKNIIKKLQEQGVDHNDLSQSAFDDLVKDEIEILKRDSKKVGTGIGIGLLISAITGI